LAFQNLGVRTLISVIFGPLILWTAWQGGYWFLGLMTLIIAVALVEFYGLAEKKGSAPFRVTGVVGALVLVGAQYWAGMAGAGVALAAVAFAVLVATLIAGTDDALRRASATLLGVVYVAFLLGFLLSVRQLPLQAGVAYRAAGTWLVMLFLVIWICDSAAYFLGSRYGRHKLYAEVSPGKTVEGAIAGVVFALLSAWGFHLWFVEGLRLVDSLAIGLICGVVGQGSDLVESLFKRDAGVKDSSRLVPGHGGILDRFDSEILVAPVVFFYLKFVAF
jgi:phosphatidate cytidylyltransferase